MTVVSPSQSNAGDTIEASDINNPINQLAAVINGNIDAANIADNSITSAKVAANLPTSKLSNPYKFLAHRNAALTSPNGTAATLICDVKDFDTGSSYSTTTGMFTASAAGFYCFVASAVLNNVTARMFLTWYKNGTTEVGRSTDISSNTFGINSTIFLQLAANDTVSVQVYTATPQAVDTAGNHTIFSGYLVSTT